MDGVDTIEDFGQSVFWKEKNTIDPFNEMMSAAYTMVDRGKKGTYKAYSVDGTMTLEEQPDQSGTLIPLSTAKQQEIKPLEQLVLPKDFSTMLQIVLNEQQQGGAPFPLTGGSPNQPWSGLSLNVLANAAGTVIDAPRFAIQEALEEMAYSVTRQFSSEDTEANLALKPVRLNFRDKEGMSVQTFKPTDIKPYRFECTLDINYPRDNMEKWMQARIAHEGEFPLLSVQTIMEDILRLQDPDSETSKKLEEMALRIPTVMLRQVMLALLERADDPQALRAAVAVARELELMEAKQKGEMLKTALQGAGMQQGLNQPTQGPAPGQPLQSPMQNMNAGSMMPMGGMQPGMVPPQVLSPGLGMDPATEQALRFYMAGMT
jgi:hypothetical protein